MIIRKSFLVTGITSEVGSSSEDLIRNEEIQNVIESVFGEAHMGYVEPPDEDPFANCSDSDCDESDLENPFASSSDKGLPLFFKGIDLTILAPLQT